MANLHDTLQAHVGGAAAPGAVALVARGDEVEVQAVGTSDVEGTRPMSRDSIFRIASITKPIVAAAVMMLVDDGLMALDDPIERWLPELASLSVVRAPSSPVDDVVPAVRSITVSDLLTFRAGWGFPSDFSFPAVALLFNDLLQGLPEPARVAAPDEWIAALARIPLLHQPGDAWLYNTCSDIQGVLLARATGRSLDELLGERVFEPLGMVDTAFEVPPGKRNRFTSFYRAGTEGALELVDAPEGQWGALPRFPSGAGGLVSTVDDWLAFARLLLSDGQVGDRRLLSKESVRLMTTDHLTPAQRDAAASFLEGQGWGYGGSVDVAPGDPWNVPGRYGWVGGTGTSAYITPSTGAVSILMTQLELAGPTPPGVMRAFWTHAAAAEAQPSSSTTGSPAARS
ncbi:serine hydrolase domain-containing protein [Angustibacter sp. McL0619]|uniref:serine hydrolase domain-containing protein n=1 Tax=Angustibacter sp. McL0619 TaxID=3415676 RepID=UPI003CEEACFF